MQISSIALFRIQCIAPWSLGINIRLGINISIQNDNYQNNEETGIWYVAILILNWFLMIYFFYFLGKNHIFQLIKAENPSVNPDKWRRKYWLP